MKPIEWEKEWKPGSQHFKDREGMNFSPSSASITQEKKMDGHGPPNLSRNKRVSLPYHQSAMYSSNWKKTEGHHTQASSKARHRSLPCRQPLSSSSKVWRPSSTNRSQETTHAQLVEHQQMQNSQRTIDADRQRDPGSGPAERPLDICRNADIVKSVEPIHESSSSSELLQSSLSLCQGIISLRLDEHQQMHTSPKRIIDDDQKRLPGSEAEKMHTSSQSIVDDDQKRRPGSEPEKSSFDICGNVNSAVVKLKKPLHLLSQERRKEVERAKNGSVTKYLRSGMVLLKNYINHFDQVNIVRKCRDLGIGFGGFYIPGYRDGANLHLRMMCLGKDWDPQSRLYGDSRHFDDAVPPEIPVEFKNLVDGAIHYAHNFLNQSSKSVEEIPKMSPDICIVNFYNRTGNLGLHQDRDERPKSIDKGLPVVSFSIGDSAEFLYSDKRDGAAEKIVLESGDVLIFGGKSRLIFHGVARIKPNTAPTLLIDETNLRPGRLNLTFRQY